MGGRLSQRESDEKKSITLNPSAKKKLKPRIFPEKADDVSSVRLTIKEFDGKLSKREMNWQRSERETETERERERKVK